MKMIKNIKSRKKKAQTALEYAMVVGAISLVLLAAWNTVGKEVQALIEGKVRQEIVDQVGGGNAKFKQ